MTPANDESRLVAPEAIEAGLRVLWDSGAIEHPMLDNDKELIRQIFLAMLQHDPPLIRLEQSNLQI